MSVEYAGPKMFQPLVEQSNINCFDRAVRIEMMGRKCSDEVVDALCQLQHVKFISLTSTGIEPASLARLTKSLPECKIEVTQ